MRPRPHSLLPIALSLLSTRALAGDAFTDVSRERGIEWTHVNGAAGGRYLIETMGPGAGWLDFDGDGFLDLYLVQGHASPGSALDGPPAAGATNRLLRNVGGKRFEDVTETSGTGHRGYGMGLAAGDCDGDGDVDLYVTNYGPDVLYRNRGDGTFEDVTERAGVATPGWSTAASWADFDGDGLLDLYVVRYLAYDTRRHGACTAEVRGSRVAAYCHPRHFEGEADVLYRNLGDGRFRDVSREAGIAGSQGWLEAKGLGAVARDIDSDGDVDVLVANDSVPNTLWRNDGSGRFEDAALVAGFAVNAAGEPEACMGICYGDADGNGLLDCFVTNFSRETNTLYLNEGGFFHDGTIERRLARGSYLRLGFGTVFLDHDLDGDLDLYVANGHVLDNVERIHPGERIEYAQPDQLFANDGRGSFDDVSEEAGAWFSRKLAGRAAALADYDNDGDPDLLVTHVAGPAVLLENRSARSAGMGWIGLELRAAPGAGTAHNARVEVSGGGTTRAYEVQADGSYFSANDPRIAAAVAAGAGEVEVRVRWPGRSRFERAGRFRPGTYHRVVRTAR